MTQEALSAPPEPSPQGGLCLSGVIQSAQGRRAQPLPQSSQAEPRPAHVGQGGVRWVGV